MMFRITSLLILLAASVYAENTIISGRVQDGNGKGVSEARVFVEPGLGGDVAEARADTNGAFRIEGPYQGGVGVFAVAPSFGFGGAHLNLALGEVTEVVSIILSPSATLSGKVVNAKGEAVKGARLTRVALTHPGKVGIPLAKLAGFGFSAPESDGNGAFTIDNLPQGGRVALKAGHPDYAQEAVEEVAVGDTNVKITLDRGVLISGEVRARQSQKPVSGATVIIRNAQPPHDTALSRTDAFGVFSLRLKPGVYVSQATAASQSTPGWQQFSVTGETPEVKVNLGLAGMGSIKAAIGDAVSGKPVEGVRIRLESGGNVAAILRTGPDGIFRSQAAEGENILYFETTPGFLPPEPRALRVTVAAGKEVELPGMWLAPLPNYRLQALDEDETTPVAGAAITLIRPQQFGWTLTGADGWAELRVANLPADGRIIGFIQHPTAAKAALFALDRGSAQGSAVKLVSCASVSGTVVTAKGKPLANKVVGAAYPESAEDEPLLLWRTVTDREGRFQWPAVLAGVPQRCAVYTGTTEQGESADFNLAPKEKAVLPPITLAGAAPEKAPTQAEYMPEWRKNKLLCGVEPAAGKPVMVVFCAASEAGLMIECVTQALKLAQNPSLTAAIVVSGAYTCAQSALAIYAGPSVTNAGTFVLDSQGRPVLATFGLPPLYLLKGLQ